VSRPQKVTDDEVYEAVARAMHRVGPQELSLAVIAAEVGVTAGALVQRFGSKRALLVRSAERAADETGAMLERLRAANPSPLAAIRAYAECMGELATSPAALARSFAYLQTDITDAALRIRLRRQALATRRVLRSWLREAVAEGTLSAKTPVADVAQLVEHVTAGALLTWAIYQTGTASRWVRAAVDSVLAPYAR
jgi:AcrR family transcriptional regulator